ncbi:MAG: hypothetical protein ACRDTX_15695 [Pseudonocardiaceae bacterium]
MPTQIKDGKQATATEATTQRTQDLMIQLVRHGQDTSLQVWAELARKLGPRAPSNPARATMASLAHDPFEKLLAAQRQVVDELVAAQRHLAHQLVATTATASGNFTPGRSTSAGDPPNPADTAPRAAHGT